MDGSAASGKRPQTAFRQAEKAFRNAHKEPDCELIPATLAHTLALPGFGFPVFRTPHPAAFALPDRPGLLLIRDALTPEAQRWLARKCLVDCSKPPNRSNLDPFFDLPDRSLFGMQDDSSLISPQDASSLDGPLSAVTRPKERFYQQAQPAAALLPRLRWYTLGRQYNWTTKLYDSGSTAFDPALDSLMRAIAIAISDASLGGHAINGFDGRQYTCHAGIVNFYGEKDSMAGHVDKTEENMEAPLISLSLGLECVYLVGGRTRDIEPSAIRLRSGDILAMCGESRMAFHGVPRVIADSAPDYLTDPCTGSTDAGAEKYPEWRHFSKYLARHRINCNARKCE
ncbi:hypothetical protein DL89DRAFT_268729 [Linderina pennispora]|uniref:Fe2OG dioxygenase domain-containing protein n=1 Tax=Linderina pennispora TaxID=61395 RepID=A0A1Y1W3T1_9FUNG|nr:uncharacterized protein DL89DRAFT_268729 [Linderina pennispora]ORX68210.1 hypothetical protein DL89DRAFT_268729 [Linderina pennispora]